jgi:hypothetical protein
VEVLLAPGNVTQPVGHSFVRGRWANERRRKKGTNSIPVKGRGGP